MDKVKKLKTHIQERKKNMCYLEVEPDNPLQCRNVHSNSDNHLKCPSLENGGYKQIKKEKHCNIHYKGRKSWQF